MFSYYYRLAKQVARMPSAVNSYRRELSKISALDSRILIIDDDIGFIKMLSRMLSDYDDQHFATSGLEGLELAREIVPDLILVDYDMPGLGGADLCAILKSDSALAAVPVIFVTSHSNVSVITATFRSGGNDFITKPVSRSLLLHRIQEQLQRAREVKNPVAV